MQLRRALLLFQRNTPETQHAAADIFERLISNILKNPRTCKYRELHLSNARLKRSLLVAARLLHPAYYPSLVLSGRRWSDRLAQVRRICCA